MATNNRRHPTGVTYITEDAAHASHVTTSSNRTGELTEILEIQTPAGKEFQYPANGRLEFFVMAHEQFTTNATAGDAETFNLSHRLADSPALSGAGGENGEDTAPPAAGQADLVLFENGSRVAPDAVRYDYHGSNPNQIDYTDDGTGNTLDAYYVFRDSGQIEARKYKTHEQEYDEVLGTTPAELHTSTTFSAEERITFNQSFTAGPKERVKFLINTSVDLTNWDAFNGNGPNGSSTYSSWSIPVRERDAAGRGRGRL